MATQGPACASPPTSRSAALPIEDLWSGPDWSRDTGILGAFAVGTTALALLATLLLYRDRQR